MGKESNVSKVETLEDIASRALEIAKKKGASDAAARVYRERNVEVQWRDGKLEQIKEATTRGLNIRLYVDGKYSAVGTSDLRPEALATFIEDSISLTKALTKDPFRSLADAKLYAGRSNANLELEDPKYGTVTPEMRRKIVQELEAAARNVPGKEKILSVTTGFNDSRSEVFSMTTNGFTGGRVDTTFFGSAQVSVNDPAGKKPEDYDFAGSRFVGSLPDIAGIGRRASERTIAKIGAKKPESATLTMAVDNRAAGRLVGQLLGPMSAGAIQQKRSFLEGKLGQKIGSPLLDIVDDPLIPRGFGSRHFDGEGIAAKKRTLFEAGALKTFFVDTYYGKKLGIEPTTAGASNLVWKLGTKAQKDLLGDMKEGILVTAFLGGNSNGTTGDFSLGVAGYRVRNGVLAEPVSELNISANQVDFWNRLVAVGNDPYPYSAMQTPTLVFEGVQFAGV